MKTRIFTALTLALTLSNAEASFNRFWIGYKLDSISNEAFLSKLNSSLVPDLIKLAGQNELSSYSPYVTPKDREDLPHEIALITYKSEEGYRKIRSTKPGIAYSDLHWELFKKDVSKSTVPVPFDGILEIGQAYELDASYEGWKSGHTHLTIYRRGNADLRKLADEFSKLRTVKGLKNSILLLTEKYIYEYRSLNPDYGFKPLSLKVVTTQKLKKARVENIGPNEGLNLQF